MMLDAYLVDLLALKEVETDRQTDGRTFAFLELLMQLKRSDDTLMDMMDMQTIRQTFAILELHSQLKILHTLLRPQWNTIHSYLNLLGVF